MATFSERYGYVTPRTAVIREDMPTDVINAVCSCFNGLQSRYNDYMHYNYSYLERNIWRYFLNQPWYKKLDLIEFVIGYMIHESTEHNNPRGLELCQWFADTLNKEFERLHYGYRIVDNKVAPITSKEEIEAIEKAFDGSKNNIKMHLSKALKLFSDKEQPDYRNSIKESISAVEALCRELTGESTLGNALKKLESQGIAIQSQLKEAFTKLYAYTNQPDTGIRHSLMDDDATYHPSYNEAYFMLVSCSAFINYLRGVAGVK